MVTQNFWFQPALRLGGIALLGLVAGLVWNATAGLAIVAAALLVLVILQLVYLQRQQRWLDDPEAEVIPDEWGPWNKVFSTLYRARRREDAHRKGLTSALDRFRLAAGALPDGVVLLDAGFHIEWCNSAAESHFGIELARDQGMLFTHIARHPVLADYLALDVGAMPVTMRPTQNQAQILSLQVIPFGEADRLLLSRDVTAIERAETIRRDFVANVSHELRTPLTVLTGFLELVADDIPREPAVVRRQTQLMREQAERMARLVEDLLTLSRLESDSIVAPSTQVDVPALLENLAVDAESLSAGRHRFRWDVDPHLAVTGSDQELQSVFSNLVSNADPLHAGRRRSRGELAAGERAGRICRRGLGDRHRAGTHSPLDRALLPRRYGTLPRNRGDRTRPGHCQARPGAASGEAGNRLRTRPGQHLPRGVPEPPGAPHRSRRRRHATPRHRPDESVSHEVESTPHHQRLIMPADLLPAIELETRPNPDAAVIWMHGLGADGNDFVPIVGELELPEKSAIRFIFPHAPMRPVTINGGAVMRAWYDILSLGGTGRSDEAGIRDSQQRIEQLIAREQTRGIAPSRLVLAGFSQGGVIALQTGLRHPARLAGIMALSTHLALPQLLAAEADPANRDIPIFMGHGTADPMIALDRAEASRRELQAHGYTLEWHTYPMQHSVCIDEVRDIGAWLARILA